MIDQKITEQGHEDSKKEFSEPLAAYGKPRIRFFNSYEEQREEMYAYWANITPIQRMAHLLEMIIMSYGLTPELLAKPRIDKRIKIISRG
jgi:hypothetical protein